MYEFKKKHTLYFRRGCWHLMGEGRNVLCCLFSLCLRSMNSSQCLSFPVITSPSSTICKTDVLQTAFGFKWLFKHKWYFFFRYDSTNTCRIFYLVSSLCTCEVTSAQNLVLSSLDESSHQSYEVKINMLPYSL